MAELYELNNAESLRTGEDDGMENTSDHTDQVDQEPHQLTGGVKGHRKEKEECADQASCSKDVVEKAVAQDRRKIEDIRMEDTGSYTNKTDEEAVATPAPAPAPPAVPVASAATLPLVPGPSSRQALHRVRVCTARELRIIKQNAWFEKSTDQTDLRRCAACGWYMERYGMEPLWASL